MKQSVTKWQYLYGLIGKRLDYSFSPGYFEDLFKDQNLEATHHYEAWPLEDADAVRLMLGERQFEGCNVTIPYKLVAAECCDVLVGFAAVTGAVNTIRRQGDLLIGYNTDVYGIICTIKKAYASDFANWHENEREVKSVLILGTGGASRAVQAACDYLNWPFTLVSRTIRSSNESYYTLKSSRNLAEFDLIVNTTPLGMTDLISSTPDLNFNQINEKHLVFDLIYNPKKTLLLVNAEEAGARIWNGEMMLHKQADLAWEIWK